MSFFPRPRDKLRAAACRKPCWLLQERRNRCLGPSCGGAAAAGQMNRELEVAVAVGGPPAPPAAATQVAFAVGSPPASTATVPPATSTQVAIAVGNPPTAMTTAPPAAATQRYGWEPPPPGRCAAAAQALFDITFMFIIGPLYVIVAVLISIVYYPLCCHRCCYAYCRPGGEGVCAVWTADSDGEALGPLFCPLAWFEWLVLFWRRLLAAPRQR